MCFLLRIYFTSLCSIILLFAAKSSYTFDGYWCFASWPIFSKVSAGVLIKSRVVVLLFPWCLASWIYITLSLLPSIQVTLFRYEGSFFSKMHNSDQLPQSLLQQMHGYCFRYNFLSFLTMVILKVIIVLHVFQLYFQEEWVWQLTFKFQIVARHDFDIIHIFELSKWQVSTNTWKQIYIHFSVNFRYIHISPPHRYY